MVARVQHRRSGTSGVTPTAAALLVGEIGANTADGRLFARKGSGVAAILNSDDNDARYATQAALNLKSNANATINDLRFTAWQWVEIPTSAWTDWRASGSAALVGLTVEMGLVKGFWFRRQQAYRNNTWYEVGVL